MNGFKWFGCMLAVAALVWIQRMFRRDAQYEYVSNTWLTEDARRREAFGVDAVCWTWPVKREVK